MLTKFEARDSAHHPAVGNNIKRDADSYKAPIRDLPWDEGHGNRHEEELEASKQKEEAVSKVGVIKVNLHHGSYNGLKKIYNINIIKWKEESIL